MVNNKSQFLKGTLEGCILKVISRGETYGYEIVRNINQNGMLDISEGTLYPLLIRLEKNRLISSTLKESPLGPMRKYYTLTDNGQKQLEQFIEDWDSFKDYINNLLEG